MYRLYRFGPDQLLPLADPQGLVAGGDVASDAVAVAGGATHYTNGAEVLPLGLHTIPYSGIYSEDARANVDALMALVGQRQKLWRERDGVYHWKWARLLSAQWRRTKEQSQHAEVDCVFEADGYWHGETSNFYTRTGTGTRQINNSAPAYIFDGTFYFQASSTGTQTFRLQETTIGIDLTWSGTMTSGHRLVIDAGAWAVTNNGADAYSGLTINAGHSAQRLLVWPPGLATVTCTLSVGSGTFNFEFYYQWI